MSTRGSRSRVSCVSSLDAQAQPAIALWSCRKGGAEGRLERMADWTTTRRLWEKWASSSVGSPGAPLKGALLLNYDPAAPSRLLPVIAEQEGTNLKAMDMQPFLDYVKRNNLQTEFFAIGKNQYLVTSIHEHWFCGRCINTSNPGGEGAIVMQIGPYLLVALYEGSLGSASQCMVAVDQFEWQLNKRSR